MKETSSYLHRTPDSCGSWQSSSRLLSVRPIRFVPGTVNTSHLSAISFRRAQILWVVASIRQRVIFGPRKVWISDVGASLGRLRRSARRAEPEESAGDRVRRIVRGNALCLDANEVSARRERRDRRFSAHPSVHLRLQPLQFDLDFGVQDRPPVLRGKYPAIVECDQELFQHSRRTKSFE